MADNFFEQEQTAQTEHEKVKIGDAEYSQEDLEKYVGLGKLADEIQTKQNTKLDRVYPEYTKTTQELKELRNKVAEFENFQQRLTSPQTPSFSPEQIKEQAIKQAEELGLMHSGNVRDIIREEIQATRLLDEIEGIKSEAQSSGKPVFETQDLLAHMQETGIRSPEKAYKDKFETQLKEWEQKQLNTIKPTAFETQESSTAGSKEPTITTPKNEDELQSALRSFLQSERGAENA